MEFVRIIPGYDHLWAVQEPSKEFDELTNLFEMWNDGNYLFNFFLQNFKDLHDNFGIDDISTAVEDTFEDSDYLESVILDFPYTEQLNNVFKELGQTDIHYSELKREKARNWSRQRHASWLRVYAIKLEANVFIVTGGAIKLTAKMQDRAHTQKELEKLNACREYLSSNGVFDQDSFIDLIKNG